MSLFIRTIFNSRESCCNFWGSIGGSCSCGSDHTFWWASRWKATLSSLRWWDCSWCWCVSFPLRNQQIWFWSLLTIICSRTMHLIASGIQILFHMNMAHHTCMTPSLRRSPHLYHCSCWAPRSHPHDFSNILQLLQRVRAPIPIQMCLQFLDQLGQSEWKHLMVTTQWTVINKVLRF